MENNVFYFYLFDKITTGLPNYKQVDKLIFSIIKMIIFVLNRKISRAEHFHVNIRIVL